MSDQTDIVERLDGYAEIPDMDRQCQGDIAEAKRLIVSLRAEVAHWKANHDNAVEIKRQVLDRPDLGDRAKSVMDLRARLESAEHWARRWRENAADLHFAYINKDLNCPHGFELSAVGKYKHALAEHYTAFPNPQSQEVKNAE